MLVEEYIQIAKEEFPYLFDEYGFRIVYTYQGEGRDLGRYDFGIDSDIYKMRIRFSREQGGGVIDFGPLSASFYHKRILPKEFGGPPYEWVALENLLWYLNRRRIDWSELEGYQDEDRIRPVFRLSSRLLKPHCPRVLEMFSSAEAIAAWKPQYEEFIDQERLKRERLKRLKRGTE